MEQYKKEANMRFFSNVIAMMNENGVYTYPDIGESFTVKGGKFYGSKRGIAKIKEITPTRFHKHLVIAEE